MILCTFQGVEFTIISAVGNADDVRQNIRQRTGNQWWADRLVPTLPEDVETLPRARMLWGTLQQRFGNSDAPSQVQLSSFNTEVQFHLLVNWSKLRC